VRRDREGDGVTHNRHYVTQGPEGYASVRTPLNVTPSIMSNLGLNLRSRVASL
jgi:hypothetical protein